MPERESKFTIWFLNSVLWAIFLIPIVINKIRKKRKILNIRNILIMESWGIGDLLVMSPILKPLKENYPGSRITVLSKEIGKVLFSHNPYIDDFIIFDFPWTRFRKKYRIWNWDWPGLLGVISRLRKKRFDLVLDARGDMRNNLLSFLSGGKKRVGYDWTGAGFFLTDNLRHEHENSHKIDTWLNLLEHLGIRTNEYAPHLYISKDEEKFAEEFLKTNGIGNRDLLVGIHPGARIKTRCWPLNRFAKVAEYVRDICKCRVVVFLEPEGYGEKIPINGENFKARLTLRQLIALIKRLDLLICNDGGAMNIATAVGTAVAAIFGPTNPAWFRPRGENDAIIIENDMSCRPCFDYCKFNEVLCLDKITVSRVEEIVHEILKKLNKMR